MSQQFWVFFNEKHGNFLDFFLAKFVPLWMFAWILPESFACCTFNRSIHFHCKGISRRSLTFHTFLTAVTFKTPVSYFVFSFLCYFGHFFCQIIHSQLISVKKQLSNVIIFNRFWLFTDIYVNSCQNPIIFTSISVNLG